MTSSGCQGEAAGTGNPGEARKACRCTAKLLIGRTCFDFFPISDDLGRSFVDLGRSWLIFLDIGRTLFGRTLGDLLSILVDLGRSFVNPGRSWAIFCRSWSNFVDPGRYFVDIVDLLLIFCRFFVEFG